MISSENTTGEQDLATMVTARADMEFGYCNLAASKLNVTVHKVLDNPAMTSRQELYMLDELSDGTSSAFDVAPLSDNFTTEAGRWVQLALAKKADTDEPDYQLLAITHNDVAMPLVSFRHRPGGECPYVQIGREMTDESFIVTPEDTQGTRKHMIVAMQHLVNQDSRNFSHNLRLQHLDKQNEEELRLASNSRHQTAYDEMTSIEKQALLHPFQGNKDPSPYKFDGRERLDDKAIRARAFLYAGKEHLRSVSEDRYKLRKEKHENRRRIKPLIPQYAAFLANPSLQALENLPGSWDEALGAELTRIAVKKEELARIDFEVSSEIAKNTACLLNVEKTLKEQLGELHQPTEKVLLYLGRIGATNGSKVTLEIPWNGGETTTEFEFTVDIVKQGSQYDVAVEYQPTTMDTSPSPFVRMLLNTAGVNTPDVAKHVNSLYPILQKVSSQIYQQKLPARQK